MSDQKSATTVLRSSVFESPEQEFSAEFPLYAEQAHNYSLQNAQLGELRATRIQQLDGFDCRPANELAQLHLQPRTARRRGQNRDEECRPNEARQLPRGETARGKKSRHCFNNLMNIWFSVASC